MGNFRRTGNTSKRAACDRNRAGILGSRSESLIADILINTASATLAANQYVSGSILMVRFRRRQKQNGGAGGGCNFKPQSMSDVEKYLQKESALARACLVLGVCVWGC